MPLLRESKPEGLSPYLNQHRDNPVDWHTWGEEAFALARESDRPVLLSVGYSTCHWCHVMERESFEDHEVAGIMNRYFVSVKVDREERPDVDSVYMEAVHAMTGRGGWPMTVFLTPHGKPFFAGTYFPDVERHGMPSFRRVLEAIDHAWNNRRKDVEEQAGRLAGMIGGVLPTAATMPGLDRVGGAYRALLESFDTRFGGFGGAPKFPQTPMLEFLARIGTADWASEATGMLTTTLTKMAEGGIRDHLGGGFARYAVDRTWLVPHFEKMLYDNADLSRLYLRAWQITGDASYREVAVDTLQYMLRDLAHPDGGFFAAEDADSEGVEGKFYVFDHDEFFEVLGLEDGPVAASRFGVTKEGNFEGLNILYGATSARDVAARFGMTESDVDQVVRRARARLFDYRSTRVRPGLDHKVIAAWNGYALRALAVAGGVLRSDEYLDAARSNARFVLERMRRQDGRLARAWSNGPVPIIGFLDDHAAYAVGLLELYQATGEPEWFHASRELMDLVGDYFFGPDGSLFASASDVSDLAFRPTDQQDNPSASGASLAAEAFLILGHLTGDQRYHDRFEQTVKAGDRLLEAAPTAVGHLLAVLATHEMGIKEVAVTGPEARGWTGRIAATFRPDLILAPSTDPGDGVPVAQGRHQPGETLGYVCEMGACRTPAADYESLVGQL